MAPSYGATNETDAQIFTDIADINGAGIAFVAYGESLLNTLVMFSFLTRLSSFRGSCHSVLSLPHIALGRTEKEASRNMDLDILHHPSLHHGVNRKRRKHVS